MQSEYFVCFAFAISTESKHLGYTMGHIDCVCQIVGKAGSSELYCITL
jgi:hypothetical protein